MTSIIILLGRQSAYKPAMKVEQTTRYEQEVTRAPTQPRRPRRHHRQPRRQLVRVVADQPVTVREALPLRVHAPLAQLHAAPPVRVRLPDATPPHVHAVAAEALVVENVDEQPVAAAEVGEALDREAKEAPHSNEVGG